MSARADRISGIDFLAGRVDRLGSAIRDLREDVQDLHAAWSVAEGESGSQDARDALIALADVDDRLHAAVLQLAATSEFMRRHAGRL